MLLASVFIQYALSSLDRPFYYALNQKCEVGERVLVNFNNKNIVGYIVQLLEINQTKEEYEKEKGIVIKDVVKIIDDKPLLSNELLSLAYEISSYYFAPLISVFQTMLPPSLKPTLSSLSKAQIAYDKFIKCLDKDTSLLTKKQLEVYNFVKSHKTKKSDISISICKTLIDKGYFSIYEEEKNRLKDDEIKNQDFLILNDEQESAKQRILNKTNTIFLLEGVTGSGKTEVYLHLTREYLKQNKKVLVLLPEISLTYQVVKLFKARFKNIAILHSSLTPSEKYDQYRLIKDNKVDIVLGARSAIFAPLENIGLIIIDEEHSETYKQDVEPNYSAIEVAKMRQKYHKCNIVLGSATPSLESRARAFKGLYELIFLTKRINTNLPRCEIVDMNNVKEIDNDSIIYSRTLRNLILDRLQKKEQIVLMLNRRGYAPYISCRRCNFVFKCPTCDLPLSYHMDENLLICHHCGYSSKMVSSCPKCNSTYLKKGGIGLQKAEENLKELFPQANILRLDSDVAKKNKATKEIIDKFNNHEADILLGTQIISKGLDFKNVTLSGVILADIGLNIPSFRASERAFSLLTQTIGRAGRSKEGVSIIQTYYPNHYAIKYAKNQDYEGFFSYEMKLRKLTSYPPFSYLCIIELSSRNEEDLLSKIYEIKNFLLHELEDKKVDLIGPSTYYVSFLNGKFRRKFLLKYYAYNDIKEPLLKLKEFLFINKKINVSIDIDPLKDY